MYRLHMSIEMDTDNYEAVLHLQEHIHRLLDSFPTTRFQINIDHLGVDPAHSHMQQMSMMAAIPPPHNHGVGINLNEARSWGKDISQKKDFIDKDEMEV